ncbi:hypothetical protein [Bdellovibrio sp. BCCA]|uniref:hypothetical protein n=1 Tax=Bdellovibrio sp. BCCA TaxID=3136281 RepID=UPI0030F08218
MKRVLALVATLCLVLGFQNCAQNQMQSLDLAASDVSVNLPPQSSNGDSSTGGSSVSTAGKVTYVEIPNISEDGSVAQKASPVTPYRLVISLQSGSIQLMDDSNAVLQKRCLDSGSLQELKTILGGANICAASAPAEDQICAMKYQPGYASLFVNEKRVNLGEEQDSCGRGRKDLCGALTDVFQAYVSHVKQHWTEMDCE